MSIRSSLLILLLLTSVVSAQPVIQVTNFSIDSSTTQDFANITIGHPRDNVVCLASAGDVAFNMSRYVGNIVWRITRNIDSTSRWTHVMTGGAADALSHAHITTTNDHKKLFIGNTDNPSNYDTYTMDSNGVVTRTARYTWPFTDAEMFVGSGIQLGTSDTILFIGRGGSPEHPKYAISTDGGVTFGDTIRIPSNASPFPNPTDITASEGRAGGIRYNGTAACIFNYQRNASDSASTIWWEWDRANREWDDMGHPIDRSLVGYSDTRSFYRSFDANAVGTTRWVVHCVNSINGVDSILWAYRTAAASDWTRGAFQTSTVQTSLTNYPFMSLTYIESSNRLVLFYTQDVSPSNDDRILYMRYWDTTAGDWSTPTQISRYSRCLNVTSPQVVPSTHGDVAYCMFSGRNNGYYYAEGAKITFTEQTTINITSLPYTISTSNRTYTIDGTKLSSATNGITIAEGVHDIIIDGQGDTIVFGTGGTTVGSNYTLVDPDDGDRGIIISRRVYNATIRNLVVKHDPPANIRTDSTLISNACAVRWAAGGGTHDILFEGCHFSIAPVRNAWIMYINNSARDTVNGGTHYNNIVRNCTWADSCNAWARRDYWIEQASIVLELFNYEKSGMIPAARPNFNYHMKFEGCSTITAFWANLYIEGDSSTVVVEDCAWRTDGWNRLDNTPYAAQMLAVRGIDMVTATENYNISIKEYGAIADGARVKVINNRLYAGSDKAGGRGIFLANADGRPSFHPDSCIYIAGNTIDVHQGEDGAGENCMGLILRQGYNYIYVRDNTIRVTGDANAGTSAYGQMLVPLRLSTAPTAGNIKIIKNTLISYYNGTPPTQNWYPTGTIIGSWGIMFDEADTTKTNWTIDSNTTEVQGVHLQYGWYNGPGGATRVTNHTFAYYPGGGNSPNDASTYVTNQDYTPASAYSYITHSFGNEIVDPIFTDGITGNRFRWGSTASFPQSSAKLSATLAIRVVDSSGNPVEGATVIVSNAYGQVDTTGTTGPNGYFRPELPYWYEENVAAGNNDSTAWNPYTVSVTTLAAATASSQLALDWNNKTLSLVAGTSTGEARPITHYGGLIRLQGHIRIDNADVPDINDVSPPVGD